MKILLIQLKRVGDILLTTPVLPYIKKVFPNSEIDFMCEPMGRPVLQNNPYLHAILNYDRDHRIANIRRVRKNRYDAVLDFINTPTSTYVTMLSGAKYRVGYKKGARSFLYNLAVPTLKTPEYASEEKLRLVRGWLAKMKMETPQIQTVRPELYLSATDEEFAQQWLKSEKIENKQFIILVPAHRKAIRQWRPEGFRDAGLKLAKSLGLKICLAWGPGEENLMKEVMKGDSHIFCLLPPTDLKQMAAIFKHAKLVITNDSGAMHVAVAVKTPTVTIYGPTRPENWNPASSTLGSSIDQYLQADGVKCLGCHLDECPVGHLCMKELGADRVVERCLTILNKENIHVGS